MGAARKMRVAHKCRRVDLCTVEGKPACSGKQRWLVRTIEGEPACSGKQHWLVRSIEGEPACSGKQNLEGSGVCGQDLVGP